MTGVIYGADGRAMPVEDPKLRTVDGREVPVRPPSYAYKHLGHWRCANADGGIARKKLAAAMARTASRVRRMPRTVSRFQLMVVSDALIGGLASFYLAGNYITYWSMKRRRSWSASGVRHSIIERVACAMRRELSCTGARGSRDARDGTFTRMAWLLFTRQSALRSAMSRTWSTEPQHGRGSIWQCTGGDAEATRVRGISLTSGASSRQRSQHQGRHGIWATRGCWRRSFCAALTTGQRRAWQARPRRPQRIGGGPSSHPAARRSYRTRGSWSSTDAARWRRRWAWCQIDGCCIRVTHGKGTSVCQACVDPCG